MCWRIAICQPCGFPIRKHATIEKRCGCVWKSSRRERASKNQVRNLAKRWQLRLPAWFTTSGNWSKQSLAGPRNVAADEVGQAGHGIRDALQSLIDIYQELSRQMELPDQAEAKLALCEDVCQAEAAAGIAHAHSHGVSDGTGVVPGAERSRPPCCQLSVGGGGAAKQCRRFAADG